MMALRKRYLAKSTYRQPSLSTCSWTVHIQSTKATEAMGVVCRPVTASSGTVCKDSMACNTFSTKRSLYSGAAVPSGGPQVREEGPVAHSTPPC